jgi:hypothetical protein
VFVPIGNFAIRKRAGDLERMNLRGHCEVAWGTSSQLAVLSNSSFLLFTC